MEIFKDVPNYEGLYQASNLGRIKSVRKNKILSPATHRCGYLWVVLQNKKVKKTLYVHRIVALSFLDNKSNFPQVNHINGIKTDNNVSNLEWTDNRENHTHSLLNKKTSSIYTGVYFDKRCNKWIAKIYVNGKSKQLGTFLCETKAHLSYMAFIKQNNLINKYA